MANNIPITNYRGPITVGSFIYHGRGKTLVVDVDKNKKESHPDLFITVKNAPATPLVGALDISELIGSEMSMVVTGCLYDTQPKYDGDTKYFVNVLQTYTEHEIDPFGTFVLRKASQITFWFTAIPSLTTVTPLGVIKAHLVEIKGHEILRVITLPFDLGTEGRPNGYNNRTSDIAKVAVEHNIGHFTSLSAEENQGGAHLYRLNPYSSSWDAIVEGRDPAPRAKFLVEGDVDKNDIAIYYYGESRASAGHGLFEIHNIPPRVRSGYLQSPLVVVDTGSGLFPLKLVVPQDTDSAFVNVQDTFESVVATLKYNKGRFWFSIVLSEGLLSGKGRGYNISH